MKRLLGSLGLFASMLVAGVSHLLAPREPAEEWERLERDWRKRRKRRILFEVAAILAVLGLGGFLVAASGIIPIKASSGHWPITVWFLKFSMHRSFSTHSLGVKVPRLGDPGMVLRGAGHYETGCRPCHGSPDLPQPRIAAAMLPVPPYLPPVIHEWKPAELFSVVKHGVKLTGMPAWPSQQRDDEVWAMVAFLLVMPELDAEEYRRLVHGGIPATGGGEPMPDLLAPEKPPKAVLETCARCHGADGRGRVRGAFPRLAGQRPTYLHASLRAFARGERHSGIMGPIAAGLSPAEMRDLARYFASLPAAPAVRPEFSEAVERGRVIAHRGIPGRKVPSCADCHGPGAVRRNPVFPVLAGQDALYLVQQLELFKKKHRGGSPWAHLMHPVAGRLSTEQMRDVALYYESLAAGRGGEPR
ncbi:MAG TPA: c-type cytochrome [Thermoanaerobaculia bacterium]|nr:c-type cytochrome [Thermoanaerobaculia bacterium]